MTLSHVPPEFWTTDGYMPNNPKTDQNSGYRDPVHTIAQNSNRFMWPLRLSLLTVGLIGWEFAGRMLRNVNAYPTMWIRMIKEWALGD